MDKVLNVLHQEGWTDIQTSGESLVGVKDGDKKQALVVKEMINFSNQVDFLLIPFEDEYLLYKVTRDVQGK